MGIVKVRDLTPRQLQNKCYPDFSRGGTRFLEYKNLFANALAIDGLEFPTATFVINQLIDVGQVGYDRMADNWAAVYGTGINELRNPTTLFFVMPNVNAYERPAYYTPSPDGAYLIKAMPFPYSIADMIMDTVKVMRECDKSIMQNLKANRTPFWFVVRDPDTRLSVEQAVEQAQDGNPAIVVNEMVGDAVKGFSTNPQWIADKIVTYRDQERDLLFNKLGIMTANINKRERVQVGEVNATVGQCVDYIYLIIDTFNKQMESYDLPYKMRLNNALEEYYGTDEQTSEDDTALIPKKAEGEE